MHSFQLFRFLCLISAMLGAIPAYPLDEVTYDITDLDPRDRKFFLQSLDYLESICFDPDDAAEQDEAAATMGKIRRFMDGSNIKCPDFTLYPPIAYDYEASWNGLPKGTVHTGMNLDFLAQLTEGKNPGEVAVEDGRFSDQKTVR